MDVFGKKPTSKVGEYFRNNVWWWHPLWDYCCMVAGNRLNSDLQMTGHDNSGSGLNGKDSKILAQMLQKEVDSGRTKDYEEKHQQSRKDAPDVPCTICGGTGKREMTKELADSSTTFSKALGIKDNKPEHEIGEEFECNACHGKGTEKPFWTHYPFSEDNVKEFIAFLKDCGGFEIC